MKKSKSLNLKTNSNQTINEIMTQKTTEFAFIIDINMNLFWIFFEFVSVVSQDLIIHLLVLQPDHERISLVLNFLYNKSIILFFSKKIWSLKN